MKDPEYKTALSYNNLRKSAKQCLDGVAWKASAQMFCVLALQWTAELHGQLLNHKYKSKGFYKFWITERGKKRFIRSVHISERCVQKCVNNYCAKLVIEPRLIYDNGASREGKGTDFAIKRFRKHLASHYRKHGKEGGILILDFHDYFNSIPHERLLKLLRYAIKDDDLYQLNKYFIDCFGDRGLGLGSELSQIAAIYYPDIMDHYIKEQLHIKGYARYMDDAYLIHHDLNYLKECQDKLIELSRKIGLDFNKNMMIVPFKGSGFTFLKRKFCITDSGKIVTRLKRENITKRRRVLKRQKKLLDAGKADMSSIRQSYRSWRGYAAKWDSYNTVKNMDSLYKELFHEEGDPHAGKRNISHS